MTIFVRETYFYRTFFGILVVMTLQNLIIFGVNLADNVMLGAYSELALSGANLAIQIQFLLQMLVMALAEGVVILAARRWGQGDIEAIKHISNLGIRFGLIISLLLWALVFIWPHEILSLFTNEQDIIYEGEKYLRIICFSYPFFALTNILLAALRSVETVKIGFVISCSTLCVNVCLNYLFIYGNFGAPELGIRGAAFATLTARIIELVIVYLYIKRFDKKIRLRLKDFCAKVDRSILPVFLKLIWPLLISNALWGIGMAMQTAILGHLGASAIAGNSIATTIFQIVSVALYASASATVVVMGKTLGQGKPDMFKAYARTLQAVYLIIGVGTGLLLWLVKDAVIGFYAISPESQAVTMQFMAVLCITVVGTGYQFPCLGGIVRSAGDTRFMLYNDFIFLWLIVLPTSFVAAFVLNLPPVAVFACLKADQILKCIPAFLRVNGFKYLKKLE